jgi:serine/threonine protein kinase
MEQAELQHPSPRKVLSDRTIYRSHSMPITPGPLNICDFGAAKLGDKHDGDVMPGVYRAPEIIMGLEWDSKIDIWSVGVMVRLSLSLLEDIALTAQRPGRKYADSLAWRVTQIWDLFEGGRLFRAVKNGHLNDELHLAEMVSLMGPPPKEFLQRSEKCREYWDEKGNFVSPYYYLADHLPLTRILRYYHRPLDCGDTNSRPVLRDAHYAAGGQG